ncbi:hypothetical protein L345_14187, partial [Ophiophagus hannah]
MVRSTWPVRCGPFAVTAIHSPPLIHHSLVATTMAWSPRPSHHGPIAAIAASLPLWPGRHGLVAAAWSPQPASCCLLSYTMKIFEKILDQRISSIAQPTINQCGFVKSCETTEATFAACQLIEKHCEKRQPLHMAFLDLEKAFDHKMLGIVTKTYSVSPDLASGSAQQLMNTKSMDLSNSVP